MPIPESQLDTWANQGAIAGSRDTYATVRDALEDGDYQGTPSIFLQGSYGNDTNIYAESDVDIVIRTDEFFYYDLTFLTDAQKQTFHATYPDGAPGTYGYSDFKNAVVTVLQDRFGDSSVNVGKRAIAIAPSGNRRSADVIVAAQLRRYDTFPGTPHEGIAFFTTGWERIYNYPKQHSANCTSKHQATDNWFKPTVRILKNARGYMVDRGIITNKMIAPSYFIEGLLHNVPNWVFGGDYQDTVSGAIDWLMSAKRDDLLCANQLLYLVRDTNTTWSAANYDAFLSGLGKLWKEW